MVSRNSYARDAVNATVNTHGINGLTRADLIAALNNIHKLTPTACSRPSTSPAAKPRTATCFTQVRNGTFLRVEPTKSGTFDCNPKYVIKRKLDLLS